MENNTLLGRKKISEKYIWHVKMKSSTHSEVFVLWMRFANAKGNIWEDGCQSVCVWSLSTLHTRDRGWMLRTRAAVSSAFHWRGRVLAWNCVGGCGMLLTLLAKSHTGWKRQLSQPSRSSHFLHRHSGGGGGKSSYVRSCVGANTTLTRRSSRW